MVLRLWRSETRSSSPASLFAALTFDDGYRDTLGFALPVLERRGAPFTVYCAVGFIEGSARLWWLEFEEAIRRLEAVEIEALRLPALTPAQKSRAFERAYWLLRGRPEAELLEAVGGLARRAGVDSDALFDGLFMDWSEVARLSRHPLATIGAHGFAHRRLAHWSAAEARAEMAQSRAALEARLGIEVRHFAYPGGELDRANSASRALSALRPRSRRGPACCSRNTPTASPRCRGHPSTDDSRAPRRSKSCSLARHSG